jgi:hypothetical protein
MFCACHVCCAQDLWGKLLFAKNLHPFYQECAVIFDSKPYPSIVHLHGAMLRYLGKRNLQEVYAMFSSLQTSKDFWAAFEAKVGAS